MSEENCLIIKEAFQVKNWQLFFWLKPSLFSIECLVLLDSIVGLVHMLETGCSLSTQSDHSHLLEFIGVERYSEQLC